MHDRSQLITEGQHGHVAPPALVAHTRVAAGRPEQGGIHVNRGLLHPGGLEGIRRRRAPVIRLP